MGNWDNLSLTEKAAMMRVAVKNGITNLQDIKREYNKFAEGGDTDWSYNGWKKQISEYMGIKPDEDNTYDYEAFFNKYPEEAWKMLNGDPTAHFSDEFKTVYHPTFSSKSIGNDGSIYSGVRNPKTNPKGLTGGTWSPDYKVFTMSPDGYRGPVSMDDRKWYLENAEDNGVQLREADGSLPVYDGIPWGGVLPNVTIYGNKLVKGGPKKKATSGWYQQHQNKWYNFLKNKGLNDVDSARLSGFFTAQDDLESAGGKSNAAREKNNFGGMQRGGKNIRYNTVEDYMQDKWKMMNSKFKSALGAKNIDEYATILGNPETAGKGYLYYVTDKVKYDPKSPQWKAAQRQHMQNYINGMRSRAGMGTVRFNNQPIASAKPSITPTTPIAPINPSISQESLESPIPFTPFNPEAFFATPDTYQQPVAVEEPEVQEPVVISPYSPEEIERQERMNRLSTFNRILSLTNPYPQEEDSFLGTIGLLTGNTFSKGGGIHIKPENRGKFTALKKRTGHSASWFKAHGTPAQKKMATFALNARKWKHK